MRCRRHVLLAAGHNHTRVAIFDELGTEHGSAQARAADLVDGHGGALLRDPGRDRRLTRGVLSEARRQHIAHDHFVDLVRVHARTLQGLFDHNPAQLCRRHRGERAAKATNRRPCGARDHNFLAHGFISLTKTRDMSGASCPPRAFFLSLSRLTPLYFEWKRI